MTDNDVEKVARAICECRLWVGAWLKANDVERDALMYEARSAIDALTAAGWRKIGPDEVVVPRMTEFKTVSKDEFDAFLQNYGRKLDYDFNQIYDPPLGIWYDFSISKDLKEAVVAAKKYAYDPVTGQDLQPVYMIKGT